MLSQFSQFALPACVVACLQLQLTPVIAMIIHQCCGLLYLVKSAEGILPFRYNIYLTRRRCCIMFHADHKRDDYIFVGDFDIDNDCAYWSWLPCTNVPTLQNVLHALTSWPIGSNVPPPPSMRLVTYTTFINSLT